MADPKENFNANYKAAELAAYLRGEAKKAAAENAAGKDADGKPLTDERKKRNELVATTFKPGNEAGAAAAERFIKQNGYVSLVSDANKQLLLTGTLENSGAWLNRTVPIADSQDLAGSIAKIAAQDAPLLKTARQEKTKVNLDKDSETPAGINGGNDGRGIFIPAGNLPTEAGKPFKSTKDHKAGPLVKAVLDGATLPAAGAGAGAAAPEPNDDRNKNFKADEFTKFMTKEAEIAKQELADNKGADGKALSAERKARNQAVSQYGTDKDLTDAVNMRFAKSGSYLSVISDGEKHVALTGSLDGGNAWLKQSVAIDNPADLAASAVALGSKDKDLVKNARAAGELDTLNLLDESETKVSEYKGLNGGRGILVPADNLPTKAGKSFKDAGGHKAETLIDNIIDAVGKQERAHVENLAREAIAGTSFIPPEVKMDPKLKGDFASKLASGGMVKGANT